MLSPQTLERVSVSYRDGYYDGYYGRPTQNVQGKHPFDRPFSTYDYDQGYHAGANDAKWSKKHAALTLSQFLAEFGIRTKGDLTEWLRRNAKANQSNYEEMVHALGTPIADKVMRSLEVMECHQ